VLLDRVVIYGLDPRDTPERVRVHAQLLPPGEPVEPGAFDFRLRAFFARLGAVGYARGAALAVEAAPPSGPLDRLAL